MELPKEFIALMKEHWPSEADALCDALCTTDPSVSVRMNAWKSPTPNPSPAGEGNEVGARVPWCKSAYYLPERPAFTFDPLLHAGAYYVQEAGSMFLAQAIEQHVPNEPLVALDLCAAPGGKSTLLRAMLHPDSLLVSNEPMRQRAQVLAENILKWGHPNCMVTQNYPADFSHLTHTFDLVVADVPCSGEGMFRKDDEAIRDWSLENVDTCWRRQRDIISDIWPTLKPGGLLIYSTCTFNRFEDEDNVQWICRELGAEQLTLRIDPSWGITGQYHFFPGKTRGEGFFLSVLRKADDELRPFTPSEGKSKKQKGKQNNNKVETAPRQVLDWLADGAWQLTPINPASGWVSALPTRYAPLMNAMRQTLSVLVEGVPVAEQKGRDWMPAHGLALNTAYRRGAFPEVELTYDQALTYLRREVLTIDAPRGIVLVTFAGLPLGFVKNLGNRANNLYPQEWRIRSGYTTPFTLTAL